MDYRKQTTVLLIYSNCLPLYHTWGFSVDAGGRYGTTIPVEVMILEIEKAQRVVGVHDTM